MKKREAKKLVIKAGRELAESGLIARTWGNVSARIDDNTFVITASGKNYRTLTEEEVIEVRCKDLSYDGEIKPSSEMKVHRELYSLKPDVQFIIHTHQENASAISAMPLNQITLDKEYSGLGRKVYCAEYALPGTEALCKNVAAAVKKSSANGVIMKHHGAVCFGKDYQEAFAIAHQLEEACGNYLARISPVLNDHEKDVVLEFAKLEKDLRPFLDDFAQMIGEKAPYFSSFTEAEKALSKVSAVILKGKGALCSSEDKSDREAMKMLIRKNCKAFFAAAAMGVPKPISESDVALMRTVYLKEYAKLQEE